jgi:hypothetical protein
VLSLVIAAVVCLCALRARSYTRTIMVISPQQSSTGQSYNCTSAGTDPVSKLPQLNCDVASNAMRTQMSLKMCAFPAETKRGQPTIGHAKKMAIRLFAEIRRPQYSRSCLLMEGLDQ